MKGMNIIMKTRIAVISIIIENSNSIEDVNHSLHEYRDYIIGRMGLPYRKHDISIISIVMDATNDTISALSGKLWMIADVTSNAIYSKLVFSDEKKEID